MTPQKMIDKDSKEKTVIHFDLPEGLACMPGLKDKSAKGRSAPWIRSGDITVVNCPQCLEAMKGKA